MKSAFIVVFFCIQLKTKVAGRVFRLNDDQSFANFMMKGSSAHNRAYENFDRPGLEEDLSS